MEERLCPSVKIKRGRLHDPHQSRTAADFAAVRPDVIKGQGTTCQYCGFVSVPSMARTVKAGSLDASGYLETHHLSGDHNDNNKKNLVLACPLCHQLHHIGIALRQNKGMFIWFPDISQEQLNFLCIGLFIAIHRKGELGETAQAMYTLLEQQQQRALQKFPHIDQRKVVVPAMVELEKKKLSYSEKLKLWGGLRFLSKPDHLDRHIKYWSNVAWNKNAAWEDDWRTTAKNVSALL